MNYHGISEVAVKLATLKSAEVLDEKGLERFLGKRRHVREDDDSLSTFHKMTGAPILTAKAPSKAQLQTLAEKRGMPWDDALAARAQTWWASDERVDGEGDIIRQDWDFKEFEKNSPMPFGHRWSEPPVGRFIDWDIRHRSDGDYNGPALHLLGLFATGSEWADEIMRLVQGGFLPGASVGFQAGKVINVVDEDERQALGLGPWGLIFEQNTLLETSPVTIPANPGAHVSEMMKGLKCRDVFLLTEIKRRYCDDEEEFVGWQKAIIEVAGAIWPKAKFEVHDLGDDDILEAAPEADIDETKTTVPVTRTTDDLIAENNALLRELTKAFNGLASTVTAAMADVQDALDVRAREPEIPDNGEDNDVLAGLVGSLSEAVKRAGHLCG